jgi:hypothetical protein
MDHISGNKSPMGPIEVPIEQPVNFSHVAIHFKRAWLAFKLRKSQKEALKGPDRWDRRCHPTSKF